MSLSIKLALTPCEGCGLPPRDVAPPQVKGKYQYQCPHYANKDSEKCTEQCWGMMSYRYLTEATEFWNNGKEKYFTYNNNL